MGHASWNLQERFYPTQADSQSIEAQGSGEAFDLLGRDVFELEVDHPAKGNTERSNGLQQVDIRDGLDWSVWKGPSEESKLPLGILRYKLLDHMESAIARQSRIPNMLDIVP
jgi:hypothetical protein